jgi:hypothetical protein
MKKIIKIILILVLIFLFFNSNRFHMSMDYFGDTKENGRLFQVFFFSTER